MDSQLAGNIKKVKAWIELSVSRSTATQAVVLKWLRGRVMWYCQPRGVAKNFLFRSVAVCEHLMSNWAVDNDNSNVGPAGGQQCTRHKRGPPARSNSRPQACRI